MKTIRQYLSFEKIIKIIAQLSYKTYYIIIFLLIVIAAICNYSSEHSLPMFWVLVLGFIIIIYLDIYSIKQTYSFYKNINFFISGDEVLLAARKKLEDKMYSNRNWLFALILPGLIVPIVIYTIKCNLGVPIKIFAYTSLYFILSLCFIGYIQYVGLIMTAYYCLRHAKKITKYDTNRPHKTKWIVKLATLINIQSNLFFFVGASFISLLYLISFTKMYGVDLNSNINRIFVVYLWSIVLIAIVIMFPIFSICSYLVIKKIIEQLIENVISECNNLLNILEKKSGNQKQFEILKAFNQIKILMMENTPVYPQKPLVAYAFSYIIAFINFAATVEAVLSLSQYIT